MIKIIKLIVCNTDHDDESLGHHDDDQNEFI